MSTNTAVGTKQWYTFADTNGEIYISNLADLPTAINVRVGQKFVDNPDMAIELGTELPVTVIIKFGENHSKMLAELEMLYATSNKALCYLYELERMMELVFKRAKRMATAKRKRRKQSPKR